MHSQKQLAHQAADLTVQEVALTLTFLDGPLGDIAYKRATTTWNGDHFQTNTASCLLQNI